MPTPLQKQTAQAIVNIFETGSVQGNYGQVTLLPNDPGHLTYGRSQTTLSSGNLFLLIQAYTQAEGAELAAPLRDYLERLANRDTTLDHDGRLRDLLRQAGDDPVMQTVQDAFFDRVYWNPSEQAANTIGIQTPLGVAVVYDSRVHGSWPAMRDRTMNRFGSVNNLGETLWVTRYVEVRRDWLANHSNTLLRRTVYRMDAFNSLIGDGNWNLNLPLDIRGVRITEAVLGHRPIRVSAQDEEERLLRLRNPRMRGDDVRDLQRALVNAGLNVDLDGVFGTETEAAVRQFQSQKGMVVDGIVGPATRAALGL